MMKNQLAGLMKQAQAMQDNMKKAQDEIASMELEGASGAGLVKVIMTGRHDVKRVAIDASLMTELRKRIKHVIYIVKENRTYDQVLGDLKGTDGDAEICDQLLTRCGEHTAQKRGRHQTSHARHGAVEARRHPAVSCVHGVQDRRRQGRDRTRHPQRYDEDGGQEGCPIAGTRSDPRG